MILQLKANRRVCITSADMLLALTHELQKASVPLAFVDLSEEMSACFKETA